MKISPHCSTANQRHYEENLLALLEGVWEGEEAEKEGNKREKTGWNGAGKGRMREREKERGRRGGRSRVGAEKSRKYGRRGKLERGRKETGGSVKKRKMGVKGK